MPPSIDDNAPLDPSQSRGAVDGRDGTTTVESRPNKQQKMYRVIGEIVILSIVNC